MSQERPTKNTEHSERIHPAPEDIKGQEVFQQISEVLGRIRENKQKVSPLILELAYIKQRLQHVRKDVDERLFKGRAADEYRRLVSDGRGILREQRGEDYTEAVNTLRADKALLESLLTQAVGQYPHLGLVLTNSAPSLSEPYDGNKRDVALPGGQPSTEPVTAEELQRICNEVDYWHGYANRPKYGSQDDWNKYNDAMTAFQESGYSMRTMRFPWDSIPRAGDKVSPKDIAESIVGDI